MTPAGWESLDAEEDICHNAEYLTDSCYLVEIVDHFSLDDITLKYPGLYTRNKASWGKAKENHEKSIGKTEGGYETLGVIITNNGVENIFFTR